MREGIGLALRGRGQVEPNPRVGALALEDGRVVGTGFHSVYGGAHAEVLAIADAAQQAAAPDTLIITMEPCSTPAGQDGKRTPPCTEAIVQAGIRRVIIGGADPDPRHFGLGESFLTRRGVEVVSGVLASQCAAINAPFRRFLELDVPWVVAKWAMSLDGKTATRTGDSRWISCADSRRRVHELRARVDAVMVGYQTAVTDDPQLTVRDADGDNPIRIVVDPLAALPRELQLVQTAAATPTWLLVGPAADPAAVAALTGLGVEVLELPGDVDSRRLDLAAGLRELRQRGIRRILMEGGGRLTAQLLDEGLLHQVMAFIAPKLLGGESAPSPVAGPGQDQVAAALTFGETCSETVGDDILVHAFST